MGAIYRLLAHTASARVLYSKNTDSSSYDVSASIRPSSGVCLCMIMPVSAQHDSLLCNFDFEHDDAMDWTIQWGGRSKPRLRVGDFET